MKFIFLFSLAISFHIHGAKITIKSPCSDEVKIVKEFELNEVKSVGKVTIELLEKLVVPHTGSELGITSIFNTPVGSDSIDVVSDSEMRAYGWCYSINGWSPELYPSEVDMTNNDRVIWWYGYAHYAGGDWVTQCEPSVTQKDSKFCKRLLLLK